MNGGDFNWDFNFVAVTQEDKEEDDEDAAKAEVGIAILREPGPGLAGESGMTFTNEYTGTVNLLEQIVEVEGGTTDLREPKDELIGADLCEEDVDLSVP